jgi:hypothetical protein
MTARQLLAWWVERVIKNTTARNVLFLYMKEDADRAVRTLESWEADPSIARNLLGTDRIRSVIWDLREFLQSIGRLRTTPEGWVDPYNYGLYMVRMNRIRQGIATLPPALDQKTYFLTNVNIPRRVFFSGLATG